jgi:hypothetical protein
LFRDRHEISTKKVYELEMAEFKLSARPTNSKMKTICLAIGLSAVLCGWAHAQSDPMLQIQSGATTLDVALTNEGDGVWTLASPASYNIDGGTLTLQSATLDSDPSVHYAFSANNPLGAADGSTTPYSMTFTLPSVNLAPGLYAVSASASGSETDGGSNGVVMSPASGAIQQSFIGGADAGVDLMSSNIDSRANASSAPFGPFTASSTYNLATTASTISVNIAFNLSDNDDATLSGRFDVNAVPEPSTGPLAVIAAGAFAILALRLRRSRSA